jgi:hypothetical protein
MLWASGTKDLDSYITRALVLSLGVLFIAEEEEEEEEERCRDVGGGVWVMCFAKRRLQYVLVSFSLRTNCHPLCRMTSVQLFTARFLGVWWLICF